MSDNKLDIAMSSSINTVSLLIKSCFQVVQVLEPKFEIPIFADVHDNVANYFI